MQYFMSYNKERERKKSSGKIKRVKKDEKQNRKEWDDRKATKKLKIDVLAH